MVARPTRNPRPRRGVLSNARGSAAIEFALLLPFLLIFLVGTIDLANYLYIRLQVVQALDAAAQFAVTNGQAVGSTGSASALLTDIDELVAKFSAIGVAGTSYYNGTADGSGYASGGNAACYCVTAGGGGYSYASATCDTLCADGSASGQFVLIQATYAFHPFFPGDKFLTGGNVTDSVLVRVQ